MINTNQIKYDVVLLGSGPVFMIEALFLTRSGKKVLIIDQNKSLGGSWAPININEIKNIENAVHYLWNEKNCNNFLKKLLNIKLSKIEHKYRIFFIFTFTLKLQFDSILSRLLSLFLKQDISFFKKILKFKRIIRKPTSIYFKYGSPDFINKLIKLINKEKIEILTNKYLSGIDLKNSKYIKLQISDKIIKANKLYITNSSRLPIIEKEKKSFKIKEKIYPRPSLHLIVFDRKSNFQECIFENDKIIKYIHDVTKYSSIKDKKIGQRVYVLALKSNVVKSEDLKNKIIKILIKVGILSKDVKILSTLWQEFHLPVLNNQDLFTISKMSNKRIVAFKTETLSSSISEYSKRWSRLI